MAGWGNGWGGGARGGYGGGYRGGNMMGMRGSMGGGMPYGYGGMMGGGGGGGFGMRGGPMNPMMRGGMGAGRGGGGMAGVKPVLTLADVQGWLEKQQPFVLQTVMKTCTNLLVTKHDVPAEDLTDWYSAAEAAGDAVEEEQTKVVSPPVLNKGTLLSGGIDPNKSSNMLNRNPKPGLAWTRSDMRHPHKVSHYSKKIVIFMNFHLKHILLSNRLQRK